MSRLCSSLHLRVWLDKVDQDVSGEDCTVASDV